MRLKSSVPVAYRGKTCHGYRLNTRFSNLLGMERFLLFFFRRETLFRNNRSFSLKNAAFRKLDWRFHRHHIRTRPKALTYSSQPRPEDVDRTVGYLSGLLFFDSREQVQGMWTMPGEPHGYNSCIRRLRHILYLVVDPPAHYDVVAGTHRPLVIRRAGRQHKRCVQQYFCVCTMQPVYA